MNPFLLSVTRSSARHGRTGGNVGRRTLASRPFASASPYSRILTINSVDSVRRIHRLSSSFGSFATSSRGSSVPPSAAATAATAATLLLAVSVGASSALNVDDQYNNGTEGVKRTYLHADSHSSSSFVALETPPRGLWQFPSLTTSARLRASFVDGMVNRAHLEGTAMVETGSGGGGTSAVSSSTVPATDDDDDASTTDSSTTLLLNWSGTHAVHVPNDKLWEPETIEQVEAIVSDCHRKRQSVRPVGSALSPNALAFHSGGMMSLSHLDQIVHVDVENQLVTVQAGARVSQVIEALRPYQLTLPNLASIAEQQMGGFVSVGAHGTGAAIAPVDHYVAELTLVTPGLGTVTLSEDKDGDIFHMAKVGLGCLGIVVQLTMKCIPAHRLVEHTVVMTREEAIRQLPTLLETHKHVRYMWIPYADAVVVVTNHPEHDLVPEGGTLAKFISPSLASQEERLQPLTDLLLQMSKERAASGGGGGVEGGTEGASAEFPPLHTPESIVGMGFGELRDALLALDPLDVDHVRRVNQAEAEFWRRSQGIQVKPSDQLLQFDCGGQQWVWEVCFPTGTLHENNGNDVQFMQNLLASIEEKGIPAPAPIEQRWSASSSSLMSPAHNDDPDGLHCWVGIINYLPSQDERQRRDITELFQDRYCELMRVVGEPYRAASHWAKLERPNSVYKLVDLQLSLADRFPLHKFNQLRQVYDPHNILSSPTVDLLLGKPPR